MAKGRAIRRFNTMLGLFAVLALVVTYAVITGWNPLPALANWLDNARTLSEPAPVWRVQVGDQPGSAMVTRHTVVITSRGTVQARDLANGDELWSRHVAWSAVAGAGWSGAGSSGAGGSGAGSTDTAGPDAESTGAAVVIAGRTGKGHGYDAVDPGTGAVRWGADDAIGVWTFTDLVVDLTCPQALSCTATARSPADGTVRWRAPLAGNGRTLSGANKALSGVRHLGGSVPVPAAAPPLLGFPLNDQVQVVATSTGKRLHSYQGTQTTRVFVAGRRVVVTTALWRDGNCRFSVDGRDPDGDRPVWHLDGYDLHTSSGLGCEQRDDPAGSAGLVAATAPDNREVLLDPDSGAVAYRAPAGDSLLATDGTTVVLRSADGATVLAVDRAGGAAAWHRGAGKSTKVTLTGGAVLFSDPGDNRLAAVRAASGDVLVDAKSGASVLGAGPTGLIINIGRSVGLLGYGASAAG